jgi:hypothetical protein
MKKSKLLLALLILCIGFGASAQKLVLGSSVIDLGFNYCLYSGSATNLCALTTVAGSMQGLEYSLTYDYVVLNRTTINADLGMSLLTGGTDFDAGVGAEYHIHFTHKIDPFDLFVGGNAGYSHLKYTGGFLTTAGYFSAPGLYYSVGVGARKYLIHGVGVFINVNYGGHKYNGGEVTEGEGLKIPYTIGYSGFNFGGGICYKIHATHHPLID